MTILSECIYPIRENIVEGLRTSWTDLGEPGTWLSGARRIAIARETRHARSCSYCALCKKALSPFSIEGTHDTGGDLPATFVEVVHRLMNDQGRLTQAWFERVTQTELSEEEYVETVGVMAHVVAADTFCRALGLEIFDLPTPEPGEPSRCDSPGAETRFAWVRMFSRQAAPEDLQRAWWPDGVPGFVPNVMRALSSVPLEAIRWIRLSNVLYKVPKDGVETHMNDAISRPQRELIAARVSAMNECFY